MSALNDDQEKLSMSKRPSHARLKIIIISICIIVVIGGSLFWLNIGEDTKEEIKILVKETINENPIESITDIITLSPIPPIGQSQVQVNVEPEELVTLEEIVPVIINPGQDIIANTGVVPKVIAPVQEDTVVSIQFLDDLAKLMVSKYNPRSNSIDLGIKSANIHYGTSLNGLNYDGQDFFAGREYILRYVFSPSMLSGLYSLYSNKFINKIVEAANEPTDKKALSPKQLNSMLMLYSKDIESLSKVLANISMLTDLQVRIDEIQQIKQKVVDVQVKMNEAIFALDEGKLVGNLRSDVSAQLESEIKDLSTQYVKVVAERTKIQNNFVQSIRNQGTLGSVDDESLIYVAYWINRRLETQPNAMDAVSVASDLLDDFSQRLKKRALGR